MSEFHVFGGSLTAVNSVRILLDANHKVYWYKMGEQVLGHFGGIKIGDDLIDLGMVFLEYGTIDVANPKTSKFPESNMALNAFLPDLAVRPAVVKSFHDGAFVEDIIISDNLELLKHQNFRSRLLSQHPREKASNDYFEQQSYETVCSTMFPEFYNRYLRCFAEKVTSARQMDLSARYHRAAWLPLYYPETIAGTNWSFPSYPLHRPKERSIAVHMQRIVGHIERNPNCIITKGPVNFSLKQQLCDLPKENVILCCKPEKMLAEWKQRLDDYMIYQRLNIGFFRAKKSTATAIDCINDLDHPNIYRVFIQDSSTNVGHSIISVEFSGDWCDAEQAKTVVLKYLSSLEIFCEIEPVKIMIGVLGPGFPGIGAEKQLTRLASLLQKQYQGYTIHGLSNGFNQTSMNSQILAATGKGE